MITTLIHTFHTPPGLSEHVGIVRIFTFGSGKNVLVSQTENQTISKVNCGFLNSSRKQSKLNILSKEDAQDSEFCLILEELETPYIAFEI